MFLGAVAADANDDGDGDDCGDNNDVFCNAHKCIYQRNIYVKMVHENSAKATHEIFTTDTRFPMSV